MEDARQYVRMMNLIRARIENGTYKPQELMPSIQKIADETGFSRHTIGLALRLLQDEGLVNRTPGLGYCVTASAAVGGGRPGPVAVVNGHAGSRAGWAGEVRARDGR